VLQGGAHAFEKLGAGDDALNIPEGFAEIIGEGSVVSAADVGIGGCLGVFVIFIHGGDQPRIQLRPLDY